MISTHCLLPGEELIVAERIRDVLDGHVMSE